MSQSLRYLAWSDRRLAWQEGLGVATVLAGIGGFIGLGSRLAGWQAVVLTALLVVGLILVLWRVWFWLFGPVLFYDLLRTTRRGRHVWLRCMYAGLLLAALFWIYASWFAGTSQRQGLAALFVDASLPAHELPEFAGDFFATFMTVQFLAVIVLTPTYVAGSISEEKERRSLDFLLASELSNREIVLGKLVARLGNLLLLLMTGLPILAMMQLLGGVDPNLVLVGFAVTGLTMLSLGSVSLLAAIYSATLYEALFRTYFVAIIFLPLLGWLPWFPEHNPFGALAGQKPSFAAMSGEEQATVLYTLLGLCALIHGLVALLCTRVAIVRLRSASSAAAGVPVELDDALAAHTATVLRTAASAAAGVPVKLDDALVAHAATVPQHRPEPGLGEEAVLWKEIHFANRELRAFNGGFGVVWALLGVLFLATWKENAVEFTRSVGSALISLMMLLVSLVAAGSLSRERERQTLESLLTTPVEQGDILTAKWIGSLRSIRYLAIGLIVVYVLSVFSGGVHPCLIVLLVIADAVYLMFAASLGLYFSTVYPTVARATLWTLLALLTLSLVPVLVGHYIDRLLAPLLPRDSIGWISELIEYGLSLPMSAWTVHSLNDPRRAGLSLHRVTVTLTGLAYFAIAARCLWVAARTRLRAEKGPPPSSKLFRAAVVEQGAAGTEPAVLRGAVLIDESFPSEERQQRQS
jgi:ABC-type transport system involved in multi-copper enzyme maturation permease subunit